MNDRVQNTCNTCLRLFQEGPMATFRKDIVKTTEIALNLLGLKSLNIDQSNFTSPYQRVKGFCVKTDAVILKAFPN